MYELKSLIFSTEIVKLQTFQTLPYSKFLNYWSQLAIPNLDSSEPTPVHLNINLLFFLERTIIASMMHDSRVSSQWFVQEWTMNEITSKSSLSEIMSSRLKIIQPKTGCETAKSNRVVLQADDIKNYTFTQYYVNLFVLNHQLTTHQKFRNITHKIF
jgi:hypothetical protein